MEMMNYLAYGSNLYPPRLAARIAIVDTLGAFELKGWKLEFNKRGGDGSGKCNLVANADARAYGAVYTMTPSDKQILDRIEGLGRGYDEAWLELDGVGACFSYSAKADYLDARLQPHDWYKAFVLAGARYHGFPRSYIDAIEAVTARPDPDAARCAENLSVLQASP